MIETLTERQDKFRNTCGRVHAHQTFSIVGAVRLVFVSGNLGHPKNKKQTNQSFAGNHFHTCAHLIRER
jgi:hypothetical protein